MVDREVNAAVKTDMNRRGRLVDLSAGRRAGLGLFVVAGLGFVFLTILVAGQASWIAQLDSAVQEDVFELRTGWLDETVIWVTRLGSRWVIGLLLAALTLWVIRTGRCRKALLVMVVAFLANPLIELVLKAAVDRNRPTISQLVPASGPSFPSGHVLATVGFYGVLAAVLWSSSSRPSTQIGGYAAATLVILSVGFSRVYLGVHWFSDVVGGMLIGTTFVIAVAWSLRGHHLGEDIGCEARDSGMDGTTDRDRDR